MITVIHPTRGRYDRAKEVHRMVMRNAHNKSNIEYLLSVDTSENQQYDFGTVVRNNNHSAIEAINNAAKVSKGDILIVVSDDFILPYAWDLQILDATEGQKDWLLKVYDGVQKWLVTIPIMDRVYYNRFGYIYHPSYQHLFCDTELAAVSDLIERKIVRNDIVFLHNHYSVAGNKDEINEKNDKTWQQGEANYIVRCKNNFDLKESDIKGKITDPAYNSWIQRKTTTNPSSTIMGSILIVTLYSRADFFNHIYTKLLKQLEKHALTKKIEILYSIDSGEKTIGEKRNDLMDLAKGRYVWFVDDDDDVHDNYIKIIYDRLCMNYDCVEMRGMYSVDGKDVKPFFHSTQHTHYFETETGYYRPPNHLNPIKKELIKDIRFPEINRGEDTDWTMQVCKSKRVKTQANINDIIYFYKYRSKK
jgi:hypothetical protein